MLSYFVNFAPIIENTLIMEDIALNRLKVVLAEKNRTGKWLGEQIGMSKITISRWVNNRMQPSVEQLFEIAKVLDVDVAALLNRKNDL